MTHRAKIKENNRKENHRNLHWEEYWTMIYTSNKDEENLEEKDGVNDNKYKDY